MRSDFFNGFGVFLLVRPCRRLRPNIPARGGEIVVGMLRALDILKGSRKCGVSCTYCSRLSDCMNRRTGLRRIVRLATIFLASKALFRVARGSRRLTDGAKAHDSNLSTLDCHLRSARRHFGPDSGKNEFRFVKRAVPYAFLHSPYLMAQISHLRLVLVGLLASVAIARAKNERKELLCAGRASIRPAKALLIASPACQVLIEEVEWAVEDTDPKKKLQVREKTQ